MVGTSRRALRLAGELRSLLPDVGVDQLAARLLLIKVHLDERAWRLLLGAEAKALGRGCIKVVVAAVKGHPDTVAQGVRELDYADPIPGRVRRPGGGCPAAEVTDATLWEALDAMVDPVTLGDSVSALRWMTRSTANWPGVEGSSKDGLLNL